MVRKKGSRWDSEDVRLCTRRSSCAGRDEGEYRAEAPSRRYAEDEPPGTARVESGGDR
jgi:hypothetical protein